MTKSSRPNHSSRPPAPAPTRALEIGAELVASARAFAAGSKAPRTLKAYRADWSAFSQWCSEHALRSLPAEPGTVALYLTWMTKEGRKVSTLARALVAISQAHKTAGHDSPTTAAPVREVFKGIRRKRGTAPAQKAPVLLDDLRAMLKVLPDNASGRRDRAILLLGFAGAFRRSELVAISVDDLTFGKEGLTVRVRRSKTDQEGAGRKIGIPFGQHEATCPVRAVRAWLSVAKIRHGPVFRAVNKHGGIGRSALTDQVVALVVKRSALAAKLDPQRFAGHSLRAGLATTAAQAGKTERSIMKTTGHHSERMVRRYIRDAELFTDNAAAGIGL